MLIQHAIRVRYNATFVTTRHFLDYYKSYAGNKKAQTLAAIQQEIEVAHEQITPIFLTDTSCLEKCECIGLLPALGLKKPGRGL